MSANDEIKQPPQSSTTNIENLNWSFALNDLARHRWRDAEKSIIAKIAENDKAESNKAVKKGGLVKSLMRTKKKLEKKFPGIWQFPIGRSYVRLVWARRKTKNRTLLPEYIVKENYNHVVEALEKLEHPEFENYFSNVKNSLVKLRPWVEQLSYGATARLTNQQWRFHIVKMAVVSQILLFLNITIKNLPVSITKIVDLHLGLSNKTNRPRNIVDKVIINKLTENLLRPFKNVINISVAALVKLKDFKPDQADAEENFIQHIVSSQYQKKLMIIENIIYCFCFLQNLFYRLSQDNDKDTKKVQRLISSAKDLMTAETLTDEAGADGSLQDQYQKFYDEFSQVIESYRKTDENDPKVEFANRGIVYEISKGSETELKTEPFDVYGSRTVDSAGNETYEYSAVYVSRKDRESLGHVLNNDNKPKVLSPNSAPVTTSAHFKYYFFEEEDMPAQERPEQKSPKASNTAQQRARSKSEGQRRSVQSVRASLSSSAHSTFGQSRDRGNFSIPAGIVKRHSQNFSGGLDSQSDSTANRSGTNTFRGDGNQNRSDKAASSAGTQSKYMRPSGRR